MVRRAARRAAAAAASLLVLAAAAVGFYPLDAHPGRAIGGGDTPASQTSSTLKTASSAIALSPDRQTLVVVNPDSDSVSLIDLNSSAAPVEIAVGDDPRTAAVDPSGGRAYVANRGSHEISVIDLHTRKVIATVPVGARPYGVTVTPDGRFVLVAEQGADRLAVIETASLQLIHRQPVPDRPSGVDVSADGRSIYLTHLYTPLLSIISLQPYKAFLPYAVRAPAAGADLQTTTAGLINAVAITSTGVSLWPDSNLLQSVVVGPDGQVYLPHTRSNSGNDNLTVDTTVFPLVSVVDGLAQQHLVGGQFNLDILDPPAVGLPFDVDFLPARNELWVVNAGSNDVTVINLITRQRVAHIEVGSNPRGIVVDSSRQNAYVNNTLSGSVSVIDTTTYAVVEEISTTTLPLDPTLLAGKMLFFSSDDSRMSLDQWMSCAACHFDGEHDGRTWTRRNTGPRNTPSLLGMAATSPLRWSGEWDEAADAEFAIRVDSFGTGLITGDMHCSLSPPDCSQHPPNAGRSADLDALAAYILSLQNHAHPDQIRGKPRSQAADRGEALFNNPAVGCATCHVPPAYTDNLPHDVGTATADERIGAAFYTPALTGLYDSAPYFHDGSAQTLLEVITFISPYGEHDVQSILSDAEINDLLAFLEELP